MNAGLFVAEVVEILQPDYVIYEDIQYQTTTAYSGYTTFKVLAELKGIVGYELDKAGVPNEHVLNKVWQAKYGIRGRGRAEQKAKCNLKSQVPIPTSYKCYRRHCRCCPYW